MHKQAIGWPMSTSKVSKYNNHNDNITISKSSKPQQYTNILWDDCNDKLSLITESVEATWIDVLPAGERPDEHAIRLTPEGSHIWQPFTSPYEVKIGPLLPRWSLGPRPHSPSKSKSTTWSREVRFDHVVTKATQLIRPHKNLTFG
jgi:hypothetical protein